MSINIDLTDKHKANTIVYGPSGQAGFKDQGTETFANFIV